MSVRISGGAAILAAALLTGLACTEARASWFDFCPAASARGKMVKTVYPVAELVIPISGMEPDDCHWWQKESKPAKTGETLEKHLIQLIQNTIAPNTWASNGGAGTIDYFPMTMTLVIDQTPDVQEQIADMLAALVRLQNVQVSLEVRLVSVPSDFAERPAVCEALHGEADHCSPPHGPKFLNDVQLALFLEMVQGEQRTNVLQAPKITAFNGQRVNVTCIDPHQFVTGIETIRRDGQLVFQPKTEQVSTGFEMVARPKVTTDRRGVNLDLSINLADLASAVVPMTKLSTVIDEGNGAPVMVTHFLQRPKVDTVTIGAKQLTIRDGDTVLLGGVKREVEVRYEYGVPVLSRIPYVNRLFKNVGYGREEQTLYVLVTPRIICADDECEETGFRCEAWPECVAAPRTGSAEESAVCPAAYFQPVSAERQLLTQLLKEYDEACAAGQMETAAKAAKAAITLDPTCFATRHGR